MAAKRTRKTVEPAAVAGPSEPEIEIVKAVRLVQHISTIVNNTLRKYWLSSEDRADTLAAGFGFLSKLLEACPHITLRTIGDTFTVNGRTIEYRDSVLDAFHSHLAQLAIDNFFFVSGVTSDEFSRFCEILSASPEELKQLGDLSTVLDRFQIRNIRTKKLIFREIANAEVILTKDEYDRMGAAGKGAGGPDGKAGDAGQGPGAGGASGDILAFLKGDVKPLDGKMAETVRDTVSDPERMAELILQAAEIREKPSEAGGGETLGDFVVACLRRTCKGIRQSPSFGTPKGHKKAAHDLLLLEEAVLRRLREMKEEDITEDDFDKITAATEEITDEIKIDAVTDEYMAKFNAVQEAEAQLLTTIRSSGIGPGGESLVMETLAQKGLPPSDWQELVVKSGVSTKGEWKASPTLASSRILEALGHLDSVLDTMDKEFDRMSKVKRDEEAQSLFDDLDGMSTRIRQMTTQTGLAIQTLIEGIQKDEIAVMAAESALLKSGRHLALTRKDTFATIARILDEIEEPIELVRTSLDMIKSKSFSENASLKQGAIQLADDNIELVKTLLNNLHGISAAPAQEQAGPNKRVP